LAGLRERGLLEINNKNRWATYRISKTVTETYKEKPIKKTDKEKLGWLNLWDVKIRSS